MPWPTIPTHTPCIVPASRTQQREQTLDLLMRSLEHAKEMQIHVGSTRLKAIFLCGAFATALATLLVKAKYDGIAFISFHLMCVIAMYLDTSFRHVLYRWIHIYRDTQSHIIYTLQNSVIYYSKIENDTKQSLKKSRPDAAGGLLFVFYIFSLFVVSIVLSEREGAVDFLKHVIFKVMDLVVIVRNVIFL